MHTLEDLGEYQRKFLKIARILINGRKLSDLDQDALFLSGLPADLETQVHQRLLITKSTHHPSDPYPITDIVEATQFLLTGSALHPLLHSCTSGWQAYRPAILPGMGSTSSHPGRSANHYIYCCCSCQARAD